MSNHYFKSSQWNDLDLAWLAGILDGEGYIGITKYKKKTCRRGFSYQIRIQVATKDDVIAVECFNITQLGRVYKQKKGTTLWVVESKTAQPILEAVLPFLRLKKNQAQVCLDYIKTINSTGGYLTTEEWENKDRLYSLCRQMKADNYNVQ